ncbi:thioesterase family protein [Halobacillus salinarum]|uniref:Thioesterase family protein n=1 Tax=Halobacillus salinarum TaxID=2932257 RepID=A0ABY4EFG7_9BACI|nr:thioesterase family protein [Halobacillus salinarum]UOQ42901.1 thioesterase family protein [Halobacillus salinarum]
MFETSTLFTTQVREDWVDYNGHMNDAAYAVVFSQAVDRFMEEIGLDAGSREHHQYTVFTLENHLLYLKEAHKNEELHVSMQLIDEDAKRLHVFFEMKNTQGDILATSEQMLMGMSTSSGSPAPFPSSISEFILKLRRKHEHLDVPKQIGRQIGIRRKP